MIRPTRFGKSRSWLLVVVLAVLVAPALRAQQQNRGHVYVFLWFDTEDYILPQSDDAAKRLAVFLTQQGLRATFKVVGEKARVLERRGRRDVIGALDNHEIGYHSNTHSQHPTVAEYEEPLDWETGIEEFDLREHGGFEDVQRIFHQKPTCYGQPGASWAPQVFPALRKWGVGVYLDEGKQVGLDGKPFWYGGVLNIFNTKEGSQLEPNETWSNIDDAKAKFQQFDLQMSARKEGGVISFYFHPCQFVHKEFWDAVNFAHGANPLPEDWKLPPVKSPQESEAAFKYFEDLIIFMKSFPNVEFVTASQARQLFPDRAQKHVFTLQEVANIAGQVDSNVSFQVHDRYNLTASEVFLILNEFVANVVRKQGGSPILLDGTPDGPSSPFVAAGFSPALISPGPSGEGAGLQAAAREGATLEIPWGQFARTVVSVADELAKTDRVPTAVWFGSQAISPESYLVTLAQAVTTLTQKGERPDTVTVAPARLAAAQYVADDSLTLWDWVIFPQGFHAPHLMSLAKLQAWTLKPARH